MSISGLQPEESGRMLCIMNGAGAGVSGGALGYIFGFGESLSVIDSAYTALMTLYPQNSVSKMQYTFHLAGTKLIRHRGQGRWKACRTEGWTSAKVSQL